MKIDRFWYTYFLIRLFYLLFAVLVFGKLTTLGDTERYLNTGINFSFAVFYNSTAFMDCLGGLVGTLLGGTNILSNFPFMLVSFLMIKWAVEGLEFRKYVNRNMLLALLSLPNFCIWTSVCSKEIAGVMFSAILGVLLVNFLNGKYRIRKRDWLAFYMCFVFKPQYLLFILQGLLMVYLMNRKCKTAKGKFWLGVLAIGCNLFVLFLVKDIVNEYADEMYVHFAMDGAESTRDNIWVQENDFFRKAPLGMFEAFYGPTFSEMAAKPTHLIAGLESLFMLGLFVYLSWKMLSRFLATYRFNATIVPVYFIIFSGICLLHYPFGIFNPGSAIRYRANFIFLFILLLLHLYVRYKKNTVFTK